MAVITSRSEYCYPPREKLTAACGRVEGGLSSNRSITRLQERLITSQMIHPFELKGEITKPPISITSRTEGH